MEIRSKLIIFFWFLSFFSLAVLLAARFIVGYWNEWMWLPLATFFLFFIIALIPSKKGLKNFLFLRTTKAGFNFLTASLICLGFLVGFSYLSVKYNFVWDFSEKKHWSLSQKAKTILADVKNDYQIVAFYTKEDKNRKQEAFQVLRKMSAFSDKISIEFKDPNLYPSLVEKYNVRASGSIIIESGKKQTRIMDSTDPKAKGASGIKEESILNALLHLDRSEEILLCYTQGHGEKDLEDSSVLGASDFKRSLQDLSYKIKKIRLIELLNVPKECNVLMIIGPEFAFEEKELDLVYKYMNQEGRLFLAIDPGKNHNLGRVTKYLGVTFTNLFLVDIQGQIAGQNAALTVGRNYNPNHPITSNFDDSMYSFFPVASYFTIADQEKWQTEVLIESSTQSFSRASLQNNEVMEQENENKGPFPISIYSTRENAKAILFADSDFLLNQFYLKIINSDIALNTISYLSGEEKHISINRKDAARDVLVLSETKKKTYLVLFVFLPLFFFILAFWTFYRGRGEK